MAKKKKKPVEQEERINGADIVAVYEELDQLREAHPEIAAEVNPRYGKKTIMERLLQFYLDMHERFHIEVPVKKKTYLWLCVVGMFGVHHFYARHWIKGLLYLAICWTGVSMGLAIIDWVEAFPKQADENGMIII